LEYNFDSIGIGDFVMYAKLEWCVELDLPMRPLIFVV